MLSCIAGNQCLHSLKGNLIKHGMTKLYTQCTPHNSNPLNTIFSPTAHELEDDQCVVCRFAHALESASGMVIITHIFYD